MDAHNLIVSQSHDYECHKHIIICCILHDFMYVTFHKLQNYRDEEQIRGCQGGRCDCKEVAQMRF